MAKIFNVRVCTKVVSMVLTLAAALRMPSQSWYQGSAALAAELVAKQTANTKAKRQAMSTPSRR